MKLNWHLMWFIGLWLAGLPLVCLAATHYVSVSNPTPVSPYTNGWDSAATSLHAGVEAATAGDTVLVSNGVYLLTNEIYIATGITVTSLNGRAVTVVDANNYAGKPVTNRCFRLNSANVILDGFTVINGIYYGAGFGWPNGGGGIDMYDGTVRNCRIMSNTLYGAAGAGIEVGGDAGKLLNCEIVGNHAIYMGGGAYMRSGIIQDCLLSNNLAQQGGGGMLMWGATAMHCTITFNLASNNYGGGVSLGGGGGVKGLMRDCTISNNTVVAGQGGGIFGGNQSRVDNCRIVNNVATEGGGVYMQKDGGPCSLWNCLIAGNTCTNGYAGLHIANGSVNNCLITRNTGKGGGVGVEMIFINTNYFVSCAIAGNTGTYYAGGMHLGNPGLSAPGFYVTNTIIYDNTGTNVANPDVSWGVTYNWTNTFGYSCLSSTNGFSGPGNQTNNPGFAEPTAGNYRLTVHSPCIDAGINQDWMAGTNDLDGRPRLDRLTGRVDIGAYEFLHSVTLFGVH